MIVASFYARRAHERHRYDFARCLRLQHASVARIPGARQIVITDPATVQHDREIFAAGLIAFATALPDSLMPAIIQGQRDFLRYCAAHEPEQDVILTGADCLILADPAALFASAEGGDGWDLAVTTHPFDDCILNTGMIAVPAGRHAMAADLWAEALARCGHRWGDDQLALASVIRPTLQHGIEPRDGLRVRFLPVPGWNDAPDDAGHRIAPLIAHFRGPRKAWMADWAGRHAGIAA